MSLKSCEMCGNPRGRAKGPTALMKAAENGHDTCLDVLIKSGANVNASDPIFEHRNTALARAVNKGHDKCVELLLEAKANVETEYGCDPVLMLAATKGYARCVDLLIKSGADVNLVFRWFSPFTEAAKYGNDRCLDVLIKAGSDHINITTRYGSLALGFAASRGHPKCLKSILGAPVNQIDDKAEPEKEKKQKTINEALILAAGSGHGTCITTLVEAGADVNYSSSVTETPLINAIAYDSLECVKLLIDVGADVNIRNNRRESPLSSAANTQSLKCLQMLLKGGALVNMTNNNGQNAVQYLVQRRFIPMKKAAAMLLFAAGEMLRPDKGATATAGVKIPEFLCRLVKPSLYLKDICRKYIRDYLLKVNPHANLFQGVPQLGLAPILESYLLFDMSLDNDTFDDGDDDVIAAADGIPGDYDEIIDYGGDCSDGYGYDGDDDDHESIFGFLMALRH